MMKHDASRADDSLAMGFTATLIYQKLKRVMHPVADGHQRQCAHADSQPDNEEHASMHESICTHDTASCLGAVLRCAR